MAAVRHLGFWKFKFFDGLGVKRPNLHNLAKLRKDLSIGCCDIAIFVVFQEGFRRGPICVTVPNFIKIGQTVAKIWRFNGFQNGGRPPSWILEIQFFLTV